MSSRKSAAATAHKSAHRSGAKDKHISQETFGHTSNTSAASRISFAASQPVSLARDNGIPKDSLNLYTTTWNMAGCTCPNIEELYAWIPENYDLYVINLQNCRSLELLSSRIQIWLEGDNDVAPNPYHVFQYPTKKKNTGIIPSPMSSLIAVAMIVLVKSEYVSTGVFHETTLSGRSRIEVSPKTSLFNFSPGKASNAMTMEFVFRDTVLSFINCRLVRDHSNSLEARVHEIKEIFERLGVTQVQADGEREVTTVLPTAHHVFFSGDLDTRVLYSPNESIVKTMKKGDSRYTAKAGAENRRLVESGSGWSEERWTHLLALDELQHLKREFDVLNSFNEIPISYPPTAPRYVKPNVQISDLKQQKSLARICGVGGDVFPLFDPTNKVKPSYCDRVLWCSRESNKHLVHPGTSGTCEAIRTSTHCPVFAVFRVIGRDQSLISKWQIISGNVPTHLASRLDEDVLKASTVVESNTDGKGTAGGAQRKKSLFIPTPSNTTTSGRGLLTPGPRQTYFPSGEVSPPKPSETQDVRPKHAFLNPPQEKSPQSNTKSRFSLPSFLRRSTSQSSTSKVSKSKTTNSTASVQGSGPSNSSRTNGSSSSSSSSATSSMKSRQSHILSIDDALDKIGPSPEAIRTLRRNKPTDKAPIADTSARSSVNSDSSHTYSSRSSGVSNSQYSAQEGEYDGDSESSSLPSQRLGTRSNSSKSMKRNRSRRRKNAPTRTIVPSLPPIRGSQADDGFMNNLIDDESVTSYEKEFNCFICANAITPESNMTEAFGSYFHTDCLRCKDCQVVLTNRLYQIEDRVFQCVNCFRSASVCLYCLEPTDGKSCIRLGGHNQYHTGCFKCVKCSTPLLEVGDSGMISSMKPFELNGNEVYCMKDFMQEFGARCEKCDGIICNEAVVTEPGSYSIVPARQLVLSTLGQAVLNDSEIRSYHALCFRCDVCQADLTEQTDASAVQISPDGQLRCKKHIEI